MSRRLWFYSVFMVILIALFGWYSLERSQVNKESEKQAVAFAQEQKEVWQNYLDKQTDEHKLVQLMKKNPNLDEVALKLITLKAYELAPTNRDVTILASFFQPELKEKVLELDPLYQP